ncbi:hypothetical protein TNCV_2179211 [Trichonephila clavipes]|uniref:Uncharacterized protein n=1 Tax=Trichonephila clavipes TaxID=2585209 RepID=A0A8X6VUH7_TRICX|nr:hypothetical protein TNCV_2179211 [Trichonephila clavipes]
MSSKIPLVDKSSTPTKANLLPSTSSVTVTWSSESQPTISLIGTVPVTSNSLSTSAASSSNKALSSSKVSMFTPLPAETYPVVETGTTISKTIPFAPQAAKQTSRNRKKNRPNRIPEIEMHLTNQKKHTFTEYIRRGCI